MLLAIGVYRSINNLLGVVVVVVVVVEVVDSVDSADSASSVVRRGCGENRNIRSALGIFSFSSCSLCVFELLLKRIRGPESTGATTGPAVNSSGDAPEPEC